jgi:hypothetical protein
VKSIAGGKVPSKKFNEKVPRKTHICGNRGRNPAKKSHGKCISVESVGEIQRKSPTGNAYLRKSWEKSIEKDPRKTHICENRGINPPKHIKSNKTKRLRKQNKDTKEKVDSRQSVW